MVKPACLRRYLLRYIARNESNGRISPRQKLLINQKSILDLFYALIISLQCFLSILQKITVLIPLNISKQTPSNHINAMEEDVKSSPLSWQTAPSSPEVPMMDEYHEEEPLEIMLIKYRAAKQLPLELRMSCRIHLEEKLCEYISESLNLSY